MKYVLKLSRFKMGEEHQGPAVLKSKGAQITHKFT